MKVWLLFLTFFITSAYGQSVDDNKILQFKDSAHTSAGKKGVWYGKIAHAYLNKNNLDSSYHYFFKALKTNDVQSSKDELAFIYNNLGVIFYKKGEVDSAGIYYKKAKNLYLKSDKLKEAAYCDINIGIFYKNKGYYDQALESLYTAAKLLENEENKDPALSSCYNTIAVIYSHQNDLLKALFFYKESLKIRKLLNLEKQVATSYNNIGIIYRKLFQFDSALLYYKMSLEIKQKYDDIKGSSATLNNIAMVFMDQKKIDQAEPYLLNSLHLSSKVSDKTGIAIANNNLGKLYFTKNNNKKALLYLESASTLIATLGLLEEQKNNLETKILIYENLGMHKEALEASKQLLIVNDSLLNKEKVQSLIEMQTKYESDKKIQEISLLEQNKILQEAEIELKQYWILGLITFSSLLTVIGFMGFILWKKEKSSKIKIETLMQELHHRVKNNLQLLSSIFSLQSRVIHDKNALEAVKSGENRVNAMAIIHQKLYSKQGTRSIDIKDYVTDLIEELAESYGYSIQDDKILLQIEHIEVDLDKVIPLGLIINELASNSFKHAFTNVKNPFLLIKIIRKGNFIFLNFQDNGPGFNGSVKQEKSMGLNIVNTLSKQLKAKTEWTTNDQVAFNLQMNLN